MSDQSSPPPPPPDYSGGYQQPQQPKKGAGMAVTALVLGILALLGSFTVVVGILFGLIAIILGFIASGRAKRGEATGRGMAIFGIITGLLGLIIGIAVIALGVSLLNSDTGKNLRDCLNDAGDNQSAIEQCQRDFQDDLTD